MFAWMPGCARTEPESQGPAERLKVVATVGMVADLASRIAGDRGTVTTLMGEGVDPHLYKASPGDLRLLSQADVVLGVGLHLEGRMAESLEQLGRTRRVVLVGEAIERSHVHHKADDPQQTDPHLWFDVALWAETVRPIVRALSEAEPASAEVFAKRGEEVRTSLLALDTWVRGRLASIPAERRVVVTAHDAFGYFSRAYGIEVLAIQGMSTESEASLKDLNRLVDTLVQRRIPAVFVETSVPRKTIEALREGCLARGHDVIIGGELFSDAMGAAGTPEGTYEGMVRHNVETIVRALAPDDRGAP